MRADDGFHDIPLDSSGPANDEITTDKFRPLRQAAKEEP